MEIESVSRIEELRQGFGKRGAFDSSVIADHLRVLAELNASGTAPSSITAWIPDGYNPAVYYHRDVVDAGLIEIYPRLRVTEKGVEYVRKALSALRIEWPVSQLLCVLQRA